MLYLSVLKNHNNLVTTTLIKKRKQAMKDVEQKTEKIIAGTIKIDIIKYILTDESQQQS